MNLIRKYLFILIILLAAFGNFAKAQNVHAAASLNPVSIKLGEQAVLHVNITIPRGEQVIFPKFKDTISSKIQIVKVSKLDTADDPRDKMSINISQGVTITGFDAGTYTIPPFTFKTKAGELQTNELKFVVESVKVDTTKAIYDIKQPLVVSYTFWDWLKMYWYWIVIPLVLIAAAIALYRYYKNKPKEEPVVKEPKIILPAHTVAINQLQELRNKKLWQNGQVKEYYTEMTDILREYLEKRYTIKTYEKTTEEIFDSLKYATIVDENRDLLKRTLGLADLVKFAKERPGPSENEQSLDNSIKFVQNTQMAAEPTAKPEGEQKQ